ncbi:hypothetical protein N7474_001853 [Penicillium riverlandense]|uniref:uncharacterized protein n=1 Tax=Penicillium riverlandense TaxID=1903569 RepID=UPI002548E94D|nr:uncharacterized protein N7474_001853 [Penicillium riverlandense]KAJ5833542.1 hypothetical protein N7474_001853 [Penicillium riverlandense]
MASNEPQPSPPTSVSQDHSSEDAEEIESPGLDLSSLTRALKARKAEYTRRRTIRVKIGTWNVAALSNTEKDVEKWFVQGRGVCQKLSGENISHYRQRSRSTDGSMSTTGPEKKDDPAPFLRSPEEIDLYVLGLQEVVDVSSPAEALRPYVDPGPSNRWKESVQKALPPGYQLVSDIQLVGLLLIIYASPAIAESVSSVNSTNVGTGLMGYMGNKGAVATRLVLGETTSLVFVNCHLAAGSDKGSLERRNWDASQIVTRTKFEPVESEQGLQGDASQIIGQEDFTFWFGDLNYRLDGIPRDAIRQALARHTVNAFDTALQEKHKERNDSQGSSSSSSVSEATPEQDLPPSPHGENERSEPVTDEDIDPRNDPASLQTTISSLLAHDELMAMQRKGTAFHEGWREGEITFLPTYKYDVGSVALFDTSEKQRAPSWCDRILFRTQRDRQRHERLDREAEEARKRDQEMQARGLDKAVADDNVLFDYDPDVDGAISTDDYASEEDHANDAASLTSQDSTEDPIQLIHYVSHQGILSSDHKPLDAAFTLTFDAVNPQLKAKIHQEVVRELDKAENEGRPGLTVVVDTHGDEQRAEADPNAVEFGDVAFDVPSQRSLTIANTSGSPATFSFAERPGPGADAQSELTSWLDIRIDKPAQKRTKEPSNTSSTASHTLLPGEVANVDLTAHVHDIGLVRLLNAQKVKLEEILVLHVDNGRDHFISVAGHWLPTCFGCSVDELTRMPESGARSLYSTGTSQLSTKEAEVRLSAPRELFHLTESISELVERAVAEWSMTNGDSDEDRPPWTIEPNGTAWPFQPDTWTLRDPYERAPLSALVREALDTNGALTAVFGPEISSLHRLEILSETLLTFLNSLSDGIVTASMWQDIDRQIVEREKSKAPPRSWEESQAWVLENLADSPAHSVSFTFVTFMLARIANEVAPVPSTTSLVPSPPSSSKDKKKHTSSEESTSEATNSKNQSSADNPQPSQPPTPASAAAFISAGSFRRKARSPTSPSTGSDSASNSNGPAMAHRQAVESTLASIFARVLISAAAPTPAKEKERRASEERKRIIIEPFLKMIGVDARGPSGGRS